MYRGSINSDVSKLLLSRDRYLRAASYYLLKASSAGSPLWYEMSVLKVVSYFCTCIAVSASFSSHVA